MLRAFVVAVPLIVCLAGVSDAQQPNIARHANLLPAQLNAVQVRVNTNFFVPAPMSDGEAAVKAQEQARRLLYQSGSHECELLRATIASDCQLESVNVNMMSRNFGPQRPDGFNANATFTYRVTLK
jgi:hypothetical protein